MSKGKQAINIFVPPKSKKAFRLRCVVADHTMQSAVEWFILQVADGKIALPGKTS